MTSFERWKDELLLREFGVSPATGEDIGAIEYLTKIAARPLLISPFVKHVLDSASTGERDSRWQLFGPDIADLAREFYMEEMGNYDLAGIAELLQQILP